MRKQVAINSILGITVWGIASLTVSSFDRSTKIALAQDKPTVVASHSIICDFVAAIAEDTLNLTCLIDSTQDPHSYRPTSSDRASVEQAQLVLYGGYQLEPQIIDLVEATETPLKIAVYEAAVTEPILAGDSKVEQDDSAAPTSENTSDAAPPPSITDNLQPEAQPVPASPPTPKTSRLDANPHVWHNVENAVATVRLIQTALTQTNPTNAALYLQNTAALEERLWLLDAWIKEQVATIPEAQKILVTAHDSFSYYTRAYEFADYLTLQFGDSDPTTLQLRELATQVRQQAIPTIFAEAAASDRLINSVADEARVDLAESELFAEGLGSTDSYIEMMVANTCTIVNGLGGSCSSFE